MVITGTSKSRLQELRKYAVHGNLTQLYFTSAGPELGDGVNVFETVTGTSDSYFVYYIGGITFIDETINGVTSTSFSFESLGYADTNNFIDEPYIKDFSKENVVDRPEVDEDVFIIRQSLPVFEDQYRIRNIRTINEFEFYAGGAHFNIVNNT